MTKIQLRRDTAANWSTNNPTPSAGEPCFETDTSRLKIGDGITAYNSLPYQGGTSDTSVTTDTAQTISGKKTFTNDIIIAQWNSNMSPTRETHIDLSSGNMNEYISASGTDKTFGMYSSSGDGIQIGTSKTDFTRGLSIKPSSLTFKSSDGTTTDLLAGGTGDVTSAGNNTFTGINIFKGKSLNVGDDNGYYDVASLSGATYVVGDQEDTTILNPLELGASFSNTVLKSNVQVLEFDKTSATKKAYGIMTKSPTNNEYMGHMAMPSDKYIDLELGASGTTYTAPADGYFILTGRLSTSSDVGHVTLINRLNTSSGTDGKFTVRCYGVGSPDAGIGLYASVPAKAGDNVVAAWAGAATASILRFIYAVGSEPAS